MDGICHASAEMRRCKPDSGAYRGGMLDMHIDCLRQWDGSVGSRRAAQIEQKATQNLKC